MEIKVTKITDVTLMQKACSYTINKESKMSLNKIYKTEHSPLRTQMFVVEMIDIPTFVSVHLVRHKIGVEHFVKSNREDRPGFSGDLGREQPVNHMMLLNAQALIQMALKRLCSTTHAKTKEVIEKIKYLVEQVDPDLAKYMVPQCIYRGGICQELMCCGYNKNFQAQIYE
jgi:hypothetical protein